MKKFGDMGIMVHTPSFSGDSIKIERLLNLEITVHHFEIKESTKKAGTQCLYLQLEIDGQKRVLFTGARALIEAIQKVPHDGFPFLTKIKKQNERYEFT